MRSVYSPQKRPKVNQSVIVSVNSNLIFCMAAHLHSQRLSFTLQDVRVVHTRRLWMPGAAKGSVWLVGFAR